MTRPPRTGNPAKSSSRQGPRGAGHDRDPVPRDDNHKNSKDIKINIVPRFIRSLAYRVDQYRRKRKEKRNQERLKDANAYETARATTVIAGFTMVTVVIACLQLCSLNSSSKDSNAVQRAFVFASSANVGCEGDRCFVTPIWQNSGNTPTVDLRIQDNSRLMSVDAQPEKFDFPEPPITIRNKSIIGPHATIIGQTIVVNSADEATISEGRGNLWIWGKATYRDTFQGTARHITCFAYFVFPHKIAGANGLQTTQVTGIELPNLGVHNCADEDCKADPCSHS